MNPDLRVSLTYDFKIKRIDFLEKKDCNQSRLVGFLFHANQIQNSCGFNIQKQLLEI